MSERVKPNVAMDPAVELRRLLDNPEVEEFRSRRDDSLNAGIVIEVRGKISDGNRRKGARRLIPKIALESFAAGPSALFCLEIALLHKQFQAFDKTEAVKEEA